MNNIIIYIFLVILILSLIIFYFTPLHRYDKFVVALRLITAFTILFSVLAIVTNVRFHSEHSTNMQLNNFSELMDKLLDENVKIFFAHPEMNYFYDQLMGIRYYTPSTRNKHFENQISMLIYSRAASVIYYIQLNRNRDGYKEAVKVLEGRFNDVMKTFLKSPIFRENWPIYKNRLAGEPIKIYFAKNLNM